MSVTTVVRAVAFVAGAAMFVVGLAKLRGEVEPPATTIEAVHPAAPNLEVRAGEACERRAVWALQGLTTFAGTGGSMARWNRPLRVAVRDEAGLGDEALGFALQAALARGAQASGVPVGYVEAGNVKALTPGNVLVETLHEPVTEARLASDVTLIAHHGGGCTALLGVSREGTIQQAALQLWRVPGEQGETHAPPGCLVPAALSLFGLNLSSEAARGLSVGTLQTIVAAIYHPRLALEGSDRFDVRLQQTRLAEVMGDHVAQACAQVQGAERES